MPRAAGARSRSAARRRRIGDLPVSVDMPPMEAKLVDALPSERGWQFEPKWDGFRCLAFRADRDVDLRGRSGKPLGRYFPEVVERLRMLQPTQFVIDGELVIPVGSNLSFDALQMRVHPAESRIRKLSVETPARLILFDMLVGADGARLMEEPLRLRRKALKEFCASLGGNPGLRLSPKTEDVAKARRWLKRVGGALDGVVAKRSDAPYQPGERAMLKIKCIRTADCVVGGFRYLQAKRCVGSLLLGLYNDAGKLDHVGFTSTIHARERAALTRKLEALAGPPGFTGNAPGGASRWSTERSTDWHPVKPVLVAEVAYDHITGDRFRHGTRFLRWRPDKRPDQCTYDQMQREARPARVVRELLRA
jgi:ATP-dependent DNA ligase